MKRIAILLFLLIITLANFITLKAGDDYKKYNFVQYTNYYTKSDSVIKTYNDFKAATSQSVKCTLNLENNPTCEDIDEIRSGYIIVNFRAGMYHYKLGNIFDVTNKFHSNLSVKVNVLDDNGFVATLLDKKLTVLGDAIEVRPEHSYKIELSDMSTIGTNDFKKLEFELYACDSLFSGTLVDKSSELTFEAFYVLDRKYKAEDNSSSDPLVYVHYDFNPSTFHKKYQFTDSDPNNQFRTVQLEWYTTCTDYEFEKYNLQLLKLENTLGEYDEFITEVDWNKALNIEVGDYKKYIDLYITQGTGYYTWRVRPIGTWYDGGISNSKNWGKWNTASMDQGQSFDISTTNSNYFYFYYQQADTNINWIHARFFNESDKGKTKFFDEITYSDELLGKRQYQKRINSDDDVVISEFIADYSGEIVVSSLPAPVSSESGWEADYDTVVNMQPDFGVDLKYKKEALKTGVNRFNVSDFDASDAVNANSTVFESSQITDGLIYDYYDDSGIPGVPKSQGYPYSRTIYYNDGTGRLREQRFPGEVSHTSPVSSERYGRVKTFYSNVSEDELIPILGKETPAQNKMFKIITIDQNGVYHITYKEFNGNTIATAIKYDQFKGNDNLEPIRSNSSNEHHLGEQGYHKRNILNTIEEEKKGKTKFEDESTFLIDDPGNSFLTYGIELKPFTVDDNCISSTGGLILGSTSLEIPIDFHLSVVNTDAYYSEPIIFDYSTTTISSGTITPSTLPLNYTLLGTEESNYRFRRSIQFDRDYIFNFIDDYKENIISHFNDKESGFKRELYNLTELSGNVEYDIEKFRDSLTSDWGWIPPDPQAETDLEKNYYKKPVMETCGLNIIAYLPKDPCIVEPACGTDPDYEAMLFDLIEGKVVKIVDNIEYDGNGYVIKGEGTIKSFGRNIDEYLFRNDENMFDGLDFYFDSANVQTNNGVINQMIENMLAETFESSYLTNNGFVDIDSSIWKQEEICDCWNMTINNFENLGIKNLEYAEGEFALYFDKGFSILDEFLECTGTMFEGYSNTRFNDTTNLRLGYIEKDTLAEDDLIPPFGEGYIENAYKYLPYEFTMQEYFEFWTTYYNVTIPQLINTSTEQFFELTPVGGNEFEYELRSYLPEQHIYIDWSDKPNFSFITQPKDLSLSPEVFIPLTNDNGEQIKNDICNGTYSISLQRIYNYKIEKFNPPYCPDGSGKSVDEVHKEKQEEFNDERDKQNENTELDDITDENDPFFNIKDGIDFQSWEDALLFYVDQCQESCPDSVRKFEARIRNALRNHAQNYITDDATRWISDFGEFDIVEVYDAVEDEDVKKLREYGTMIDHDFAEYDVIVFPKERIDDYIKVLEENCKSECLPICLSSSNNISESDLTEFLHDDKNDKRIFDKKGEEPIDVECLIKDIERINLVTTSDYELRLPEMNCFGEPMYCEGETEVDGYFTDDWKTLRIIPYYMENGEKKVLPYPESSYRKKLISVMNNTLNYLKTYNMKEVERMYEENKYNIKHYHKSEYYRDGGLRIVNWVRLFIELINFDNRFEIKFQNPSSFDHNKDKRDNVHDYVIYPCNINNIFPGFKHSIPGELRNGVYDETSPFNIPRYCDKEYTVATENWFSLFNNGNIEIRNRINNKLVVEDINIDDNFIIEGNQIYFDRIIKNFNSIWQDKYWLDEKLKISDTHTYAPDYLEDFKFQFSGLNRDLDYDGNRYYDDYDIIIDDVYTTLPNYDGTTMWERDPNVEGAFHGKGKFAVIPEYPEFDIDTTHFLCFRWIKVDPIEKGIDFIPTDCEDETPSMYLTSLENQIEDIATTLTNRLYDKIFEGIHPYVFDDREPNASGVPLDTMYVTTPSDTLQKYTLYYYDISNNLVKTVAPKGVTVDKNRTRNDVVEHDYESKYKYNSMGQMIESKSPDQNASGNLVVGDSTYSYDGETIYVYDLAGRLRITVNPKQMYNEEYDACEEGDMFAPKATYFKYDNRGRLVESGEFSAYFNNNMAHTADFPYLTLGNYLQRYFSYKKWGLADSVLNNSFFKYKRHFEKYLLDNIDYPTDRNESGNYMSQKFPHNIAFCDTALSPTTHLYRKIGLKTITLYDKPDANLPILQTSYGVSGQKHLVNRISSITRITDSEWEGSGLANKDRVTSYYSYDPHGNVDWYYQEILPGKFDMPGLGTLAQYEYDLLSGNVHEISYQNNYPEEFTQYFEYDSDNRIINVSTSRHGILVEDDTKYEYYPHGPLKRRSVGADSLQGLDYYYTIHGWLKGINSVGGAADELGKDGAIGDRQVVGKDIFSMSLNYYQDDYSSAMATGIEFWNENDDPDNNLYDGNISSWKNKFNSMYYPEVDSMNPLFDDYHAQYKYDLAGRLVESQLDTFNLGNRVAHDKYKTQHLYDLNGNMDTLTRYDNFSVPNLIVNQIGPDNNQLASSAQTEPGGLTIYGYDNMGNLEMEVNPQTETMDQIHWTADGKLAVTMKNVLVKDSNTHDEHILNLYQHYYYDGMGNRVLKVGNGKLDPTGPGVDPIVIHCNEDIGTSPCTTCQEDLNVRGYYYGREAGGKVLATYETSPEGITGMGTGCYDAYYYQNLKEWYIYGSESDGRIAVQRPYPNEFTDNLRINALHLYDQAEPYAMKDTIIEYQANTIGSYTSNARFKGYKEYEIKDHLGNVRAVISDVKNPLSMYGSIDNWTFRAEILNLSNYYPYGLQIPTGIYSSNADYNFGYNGMEKDDELKGSGEVLNYGARLYKAEGTFLSLDPKMSKYPMLSPYIFGNNNPIKYLDFDGREFRKANAYKNLDQYNSLISKLEDSNIMIYNYGEYLIYDNESKRFVEDPNRDKYENYTNVVFEITVKNIDGKTAAEERSIATKNTSTTTIRTAKGDIHLNGMIESSIINNSLELNDNILTYSSETGDQTIDLNKLSVDEASNIIHKEWQKIREQYKEVLLKPEVVNNEIVIKITIDDYINTQLYNQMNQLYKMVQVIKHELGHQKGSTSNYLDFIKSEIYKLIDLQRKERDRKGGHDKGNPSGKKADEWERK